MKNWIGEVLGAPAKPLAASKAILKSRPRRSTLSRVIGEAAPAPEADEVEAPQLPPPPQREPEGAPAASDRAEPPAPPEEIEGPAEEPDETSQNGPVDALVSAWQSGGHTHVAQSLLDGINSYTDLVSLFFSIGPEGASELARLMDELSSEEETEDGDDLLPPPPSDSEPPTRPGRNLYNEHE